jgi:hypothetical protein
MANTVNISRDIWDSSAFARGIFSEREAWIWLICEASWKPRTYRAGDFVVELQRGELAASVRYMAKAWQWTPAKVQRFLERLRKLEMICAKTDTGVTQVSICNYDKYQDFAQGADTGPIQDRYRTDTEKKPDKPDKPDKEEDAGASSKKKPASRGTRLDADWFLPVSWGQWAVSEGWAPDDLRIEADKFRDYWHSKAGPTAVKMDWQATWRNWIRAAAQNKPKHTNGTRHERKSFDAAINATADMLSAGTIRIDNSSRDPFAVRPRGNA